MMKYILLVLLFIPLCLRSQNTELTVIVNHPVNQYADGVISVTDGITTFEKNLENGQAHFVLKEVLSVKDQPNFNMAVYPNPAENENVTIEISGQNVIKGKIEFFDISGHQLGLFDLDNSESISINNASDIIIYQYQDISGKRKSGKILTTSKSLQVIVLFSSKNYESLYSDHSTSNFQPSPFSKANDNGVAQTDYTVTYSDLNNELATIVEVVPIEEGKMNNVSWTADFYSRLIVHHGSGSGRYDVGKVVTVKADEAEEGYVFDHWMGDVGGLDNPQDAETAINIMGDDVSITAHYQLTTGKVQLPIEVMGAPGYIEEVVLNLGEKGSQAQKLWVRVHNISYNGKGRFRVNDGVWHSMSNFNEQLILKEQDKAYGGFGGGFSTITFTMDKAYLDFKDGENKIEFEYKYRSGPTAGYRVIALNILDVDNTELIADDVFFQDDPHSWEPILTSQEDIDRGEWLWKNYDLGIAAKCTNCHTASGMDLKYFNVSNRTIVEQAKKSNLTQIAGEQIASYIRSLPFTSPKQARVYNPPYQPGPGIDDQPVFEWAAGAGLNAVLEKDEDMLPFIFGDGSRASIDAATDIRTDLNLREMPVAVQFPDWLHWIPRINPIDIWGENIWFNSEGYKGKDNAQEAYETMRGKLDMGVAQLIQNKNLISTLERFAWDLMFWMGHDNNTGHPWTATIAPMLDQRKSTYTAEQAKHNLALWQNMKFWEVMMEYELQDKADDERSTAEKFNWPVNRFSMFVIPAHFTGDDRGTSHFAWESQVVGTYFSSIWYQLQITVNAGMRSGYNVAPSDWSYNLMHINLMGERTGIYEPLRYSQNLIKTYQQRDKDVNDEIIKSNWTMREVSPWRVYSNYRGDQETMELLNTYREGLRGDVTSSLLTQWLRKSNEYDLNKWPRTSTLGFGSDYWYLLEDENYDPTDQPNPGKGAGKLFAPDGSSDAIEAHAFYRLLDGNFSNGQNRLEVIGVDQEVIQGLAEWADKIWINPDTNWFNWQD